MDVRDTLLLVNDNSSSRAALQSIFEPNYNLLEAENGEQALLLMEENHRCIAAVLLDTVMPIKDGYQVLTEMGQRELLNELPVIILTDETNPDIESKAFDLGASEVITAPYDLYCVQRRVQNIIQLNRKRWRLEIALEKQSALPLHAHEIMVDTLTSLIESRDLQSGHHVSRVRYLTQVLLQEVARSCPEYGLTPEQIRLISSAATFHDIGKITLSDALLTKPGPLTPEETAIMQNHTLAGCRVLEGMGYIGDDTYLRYAYNICRYHHERWDGCGYPEGLKGDAIPICAQVVGMVDAYDALTSNSAHKTAYPHALAINMILNGECGMFSPKLLECLKQISVQFLDAPAANTSSQPQTTEKITDPLPGPLPQQGLDTPQSVQLKYQALLQHLDATVLEADLDNNLCHLVYNASPCFSFLSSASFLSVGIQSLFERIVLTGSSVPSSTALLDQLHSFIDHGLRCDRQRYPVYNADLDNQVWCDFTFLRIDPLDTTHRRVLILCQEASTQSAPVLQPAATSTLKESDIYQLLAGTYCCRNDPWLTLEGPSPSLSSLLRYSDRELNAQFQNRLINLILPEDRQMVRRQLLTQLSQGRSIEMEYRMTTKDGRMIWVLNKGYLSFTEHGTECIHCILVDITQSKQALESLRVSLEQHQIIMAQTDDIVFEWNIASDTVTCSNKWQALFGYEPLSKDFSSRVTTLSHIHPDDIPTILQRMQALKSGSDYQDTELRIANSDGRYLWCRFRATAQYDDAGTPIKAVGVIINIDAEKRAALALQNKAEQDTLTKLLNKDASRLQVENRLQLRRPKEQAALLVLDLDNFKQVNDQHGHMFGDTVLTQTAAEIRRFFRSDDIIARIGGDEFMIFMSNIPGRELVEHRCHSLIDAIQTLFRGRLADCGLSCSVGIALAPEHGSSYQELFQRADMALYRAKASGKHCCAFYDATDHTFLPKAMAIASARTAIDSDEHLGFSDSGLIRHVFQQLYESSDLDGTVQTILELVGNQMNVSRVYMFENSPDNKTCCNTFEWCNKGISSEIDDLQHVSYETDVPGYEENFDARGIFYCPDISALRKEHYNFLATQGIKSLLQCAIYDNGVFRGIVGFDECSVNRLWTQDQIDTLKLLSEILSVFLLKKRAQDKAKHL